MQEKEASIAPFELLIHSSAPIDIINYSTSHYFIQMIFAKNLEAQQF